jgi:hypothetical protein
MEKKAPRRSKLTCYQLHLAIIFDLDNVLVKSSYKKDKSREYDACVYMSILNSKKIKVSG